MTRFSWTPELSARLRTLYLDRLLSARSIALRMGIADVMVVRRRIGVMRLAAERGAGALDAQRRASLELAEAGRAKARAARGQLVWTPAMRAVLEHRYLALGQAPGLIAQAMALDARQVRRAVKRFGLAARRRAAGGKRARVARLADLAVANVVRLPARAAGGLSALEGALWSPGPALAGPTADQRRRATAASSRNRELRRRA